MIKLKTVSALRRQVAEWRRGGERIALVPTMGNLHRGHLELVRKARTQADRVIVTIFVNPMQFGAGEDLDAYPRTPEQDREKLISVGADLLFSPSVEEVYGSAPWEQTRVEVPGISDILCGASRPGHFTGVATVVCKLFNMAQPDIAVFGEKDFQQLLVIRRMVEDLSIPVKIYGVATVREADGLARSSRNAYLTADERSTAPLLYATLQETAEAIGRDESDLPELERRGLDRLREAGFTPDYLKILRTEDLAEPVPGDKDLVIVTAARIGRARLIDNLRVRR